MRRDHLPRPGQLLRRTARGGQAGQPTGGQLHALEGGGVVEAPSKDVDRAVEAAHIAFETSWGTKVPGSERGKLLLKLAELIERDLDEIAAIESLDNG